MNSGQWRAVRPSATHGEGSGLPEDSAHAMAVPQRAGKGVRVVYGVRLGSKSYERSA